MSSAASRSRTSPRTTTTTRAPSRSPCPRTAPTGGSPHLVDGNRIKGFTQSPELPYWINAGVYVFNPDVLGLLPDKGDHEDTTFPELARDGRLVGFRLSGYWRGIDTVKDMIAASHEVVASGEALAAEYRTAELEL